MSFFLQTNAACVILEEKESLWRAIVLQKNLAFKPKTEGKNNNWTKTPNQNEKKKKLHNDHDQY
jgi:hypothetical protein